MENEQYLSGEQFFNEIRQRQVLLECLNNIELVDNAYKNMSYICGKKIHEYANMIKNLAEKQNNGYVLEQLQFAGLVY